MISLPSPETVETAISLLSKVPTTWAAVPELSHRESQALYLLVAAGLVERKVSMRICRAGDKQAVATSVSFYGEGGFAQSLEMAFGKAAKLWGENWYTGPVFWETSEGQGGWRLTDQGELALSDLNSGEKTRIDFVRDWLRTPGVAGVKRFLPPFAGILRPIVNGEGYAVSTKILNTESEPANVRVVNAVEVAGLADMAQDMKEALQHMRDSRKDEKDKATKEPIGVTLRQVAAIFAHGDLEMQEKILKRWNKKREPKKPQDLGVSPSDMRCKIYRITAILKWAKKVEGFLPQPEDEWEKTLTRVAMPAVKKNKKRK